MTTKPPHASIAAEALFSIGPVHFTNSMLMTIIVMVILVVVFALGTRKMSVIPGRFQNALEAIVELILGMVEGTAGKRTGRRIFPLIATIFIFVLFANWFSLLPGVGSITVVPATEFRHVEVEHAGEGTTTEGTHTEGTTTEGTTAEGTTTSTEVKYEEVPLFRAPNADLNTTAAMALIAVIVVQAFGIMAHGLGGYLKEMATPPFLTPVHVIGELSRILSLAARLFGNIFGGEVLLAVMYYLFSLVFVGFLNFIFVGLELFFGAIQALLFSLLTLNYIAAAVGGHGDSHADPHVAGAETMEHSEASGTMRHMA